MTCCAIIEGKEVLPMQKKKWIGNILLVLTALIWGTAFVFQRVGMESIEPITFTAARMSIAAAAVGLVTVIAHRIFKKSAAVTPTTNRRLTVIGGIVCGVFLASAMKHIDKCESNPDECRKTNIDGCINVINASIDRKVKKLIFLSTDKATNPTTIYGCSKLFVEMYAQCVNNKDTDIIRTRYGNVFGSNGSVAWIFDKLSKEGKKLTITNPDMTRFFMSLDEAVDLVLYALDYGKNGDLWVYKNKSCTIKELADLFSENQEIIGNRCIEKTDEALLTINELKHSKEYGNYIRVAKELDREGEFIPFTSDSADRFTKEELQTLLENWRRYENSSIELRRYENSSIEL